MRRTILFLLMIIVLIVGVNPALAGSSPAGTPTPFFRSDSGVTIELHRVNIEIDNQVATTRIEQVFANHTERMAEGTYVFPLPVGAAVSDLVMWVDGRPIEAKILDAHGYKAIYNDRLMVRVSERITQLENGDLKHEDVTVRGSLEFLRLLSKKDVTMYIFSGTDREDVRNESALIGAAPYFQEIWGALKTYTDYNKEMVLKDIITKNNLHGSEVLIVGDGPVEIRNARANECVSIGVASDEIKGEGWNMEKRARLVSAGADIMIPDFSDAEALVEYLFQN